MVILEMIGSSMYKFQESFIVPLAKGNGCIVVIGFMICY